MGIFNYSQAYGGGDICRKRFEPIFLPPQLQEYVRYVVALDPTDEKPYSISIRGIGPTQGMRDIFDYLQRNLNRKHKKHVQAWMCQSSVCGEVCALGDGCPNVHVSPEGYIKRRLWVRPLTIQRLSAMEASEGSASAPSEASATSRPVSPSSEPLGVVFVHNPYSFVPYEVCARRSPAESPSTEAVSPQLRCSSPSELLRCPRSWADSTLQDEMDFTVPVEQFLSLSLDHVSYDF